jgi:hypothetical protein
MNPSWLVLFMIFKEIATILAGFIASLGNIEGG